MEKYEDNKEISEDKKRLTTVSFNENIINSKYGCQSPNFLLLKKLLKTSQNYMAEEKDVNKPKESIVYNAQRETQIFNINHTINKIKKLKRIYENEINNGNGNDIKNKEYFSTNNSNSNLQMNIKKAKTKATNDIAQNNYVYKKQKIINNNISPIKKNELIFNANGNKNIKKELNNYNSISNINQINNNELIIYENIYFNNENNKENSMNKKNINNNYKHNTDYSLENIDNIIFKKNTNNTNLNSHKDNKNKQNKILGSERNITKYVLTNINSLNKSPVDNKNKINFSQSKKNSNSIKVNKKIQKNKKKNVKQKTDNQCSLTNKINSIKKSFNIDNKDIFILDNKKEEIINYITNHNNKINSTRSQKYIINRNLGETLNISIKNGINKKRNQYTAKLENSCCSNYSEKKIKKMKSTYSNKEVTKYEIKNNNNFEYFNNRFNVMRKNREISFNDENQNYNNKIQIKNRYTVGPEKRHKYSEEYILYKNYFNINNNNNNIIIDNSKNESIKKKINRSVSVKKEHFKNKRN